MFSPLRYENDLLNFCLFPCAKERRMKLIIDNMETFDQRLNRFKNNSPIEFIETLINGQHNYTINQLEIAHQHKLDSLLILGVHAVIENLSEYIFLKKGVDGIKFYLENFVDGDTDGLKFSLIAKDLNNWRNIIAHQFLSKQGHYFGYDYTINTGYIQNGDYIRFNPTIYFEQFKSAFLSGEKTKYRIHDYTKLLTPENMEKAKEKFLSRFN